MRTLRSSLSILSLPGVLALAGCQGPAPALEVEGAAFSQEVLASLSVEQVDLLAALAALGSGAATGSWDHLATPRLAAGERTRMAERLRDELILEGAGISEGELEARYAAAPQYELEVRHLVVLSERWQPAAVRQDARARAEAGLVRIQEGEPFERVAADVSEEPGAAARGGLLRPGRAGTWVEEFWEAASRLVEGGVSPVIETPFGFHVLRLEARRTLPFLEARPSVVREVARTLGGGEAWEQARARWIAEVEILEPRGVLATSASDDAGEGASPPIRGVVDFVVQGPSYGADPDIVVARWPGGSLTTGDLRMHLLSLPAGRLRRILDPTNDEELEAEILRAAEAHVLVERARERGLQPTDADREARLREWETQAGEWVALLGFTPDADAGTRRDQALQAMRATGQNAQIARSGVAEAAPMLLSGVRITGDFITPRVP